MKRNLRRRDEFLLMKNVLNKTQEPVKDLLGWLKAFKKNNMLTGFSFFFLWYNIVFSFLFISVFSFLLVINSSKRNFTFLLGLWPPLAFTVSSETSIIRETITVYLSGSYPLTFMNLHQKTMKTSRYMIWNYESTWYAAMTTVFAVWLIHLHN